MHAELVWPLRLDTAPSAIVSPSSLGDPAFAAGDRGMVTSLCPCRAKVSARLRRLLRRSRQPIHLASEDREDRKKQTQHNAENDARDDGKIKCGMLALDPDVAGQSSQPFWRKTSPHHQSHQRRDHTEDHDESAQLPHHSKSCADRAKAQA